MTAPKPLKIVHRDRVPLGHLWLELTRSECGAVMWALCPPDSDDVERGPCKPAIASGHVDAGTALQLRVAAARAEDAFAEAVG